MRVEARGQVPIDGTVSCLEQLRSEQGSLERVPAIGTWIIAGFRAQSRMNPLLHPEITRQGLDDGHGGRGRGLGTEHSRPQAD